MWQTFRLKCFAINLLALILTVCFVCWNAGCSYLIWKSLNNWVFLCSLLVFVPLWYKVLAECRFFHYIPIYIVLLSHFTIHDTRLQQQLLLLLLLLRSVHFSVGLYYAFSSSCPSVVIFMRFWVMILWKPPSGFSLTFSHNLPICNTAYDSYPGCMVTTVSVLFARCALRQKKQSSVERAWLGYHMRSVGGTWGGSEETVKHWAYMVYWNQMAPHW